ncbi:MAG: FHA domain-containing protein [Sterolibacterium sp.]|nr:FHA domain-containing protein [Sterolibacterium sp.]
MAKIILSMEGMVLKDIALDKERLTIGRRPHNDIQIDNLAISGEHAVIVCGHNEVLLEDLNSTNGTQVNGHPIRKHLLKNGDVIELGKYRLKFFDEVPFPQARKEAFERTQVVRPGSVDLPPAIASSHADTRDHLQTSTGWQQGEPAADGLPRAVIQILSGANAGKELALTKSLTTLGKPGVQVAVIARRPQGYFMTHVEGNSFPSVNGQPLDVQAHPLSDHDIIELGGIKMEFFFKA